MYQYRDHTHFEDSNQVITFDISVHVCFSKAKVTHCKQPDPKNIVCNAKFHFELWVCVILLGYRRRRKIVDMGIRENSKVTTSDVLHQTV